MLNIDVKEVAVSAQDHEAIIKPEEFPAETLSYWLTYGIRRAYQDGINSVAKKLRDDGKAVDGAELFADRDKIFREAKMSTRDGTGDSAEVREAKSRIRAQIKESNAKAYKNASPEERTAMVDAAWNALPEEQRAAHLRTAKARLELKARQAAELAALDPGVEV